MSTATLLDPACLGDHVDRLYRAAWGMCRSHEDAEDLVQETCARVLARPRLVLGSDEVGYLLTALRNEYSSQQRKARCRPRAVPFGEEHDPADPRRGSRPDEAVPAREVFTAIARLTPDFRDALLAIDVVGLRYGEAAEVLGVKEGTITTRLSRARERVARDLAA